MRRIETLIAALLLGCSPSSPQPTDGRSTLDMRVEDAAPDTPVRDATIDAHATDVQTPMPDAALDQGPLQRDAAPPDARSDAIPVDAQPDAIPFDAAPFDGATLDMTPPEIVPDAAPDLAVQDAAIDAVLPDAAPDAVLPDAAPPPPRAPMPGELQITEIMIDPVAVPDARGEWFEVQNTSDAWLDLDGLTLLNARGEGVPIEGLLALAPGRFGVIGLGPDPEIGAARLHARFADRTMRNAGDTLILQAAAEITRQRYDAEFPLMPGASLQRDAEVEFAADPTRPGAWCASRTIFGAGDRGTPGAPNLACRGAMTAAEFQDLIVFACPGCHTENGRLGGLNLDDHARSIGRPSIDLPAMALIEPGNRQRSYLYLKLTDTHEAVGGVGDVMPPLEPLDPITIERIGRYIDGLP